MHCPCVDLLMADPQPKIPQIPAPIGRVEFLKSKYEGQLSDDNFNKLFEADPTSNKRYLQWLLVQFTKGSLLREDIYKAADDLAVFDKHKKQLKVRDINQIESPQALYRIVETYIEKPTGKEIKRSQKDKIWQDIETVYDGPDGKILIPKTEAASCYLGQGTRWCTAATKAHNEFEAYNKDGPLLVIIPNSGSGEKYQFHLHSASLMDEADRYVEALPTIPSGIWSRVLDWVDAQPEDIKFAAVKSYGYAIQFIKNPSEHIKRAAVKQYGHAIKYIENPSDEVKLTAVKRNGSAIQFIKNPSEEMKITAVRQNGYAVRYIKDPSDEVKLAAIKQKGNAIKFIKSLSDEMKLAAIKQNGGAIQSIKDASDEMKIAAVKQDGHAIQYIKNPSSEVKLAAVKQNGHAIQYIQTPSVAVQVAAAKQNGIAINHIDSPSEEMQIAAVINNPEALEYMDNPSDKVIEIVNSNRRHFQHPTLGIYSAPQNLIDYATKKGYKKEVWEAALKLHREKGHEGVIQMTQEMLELGRPQTQTKQLSQANTMQR